MTQNRVRPGLPALRLTLGMLVLTAGTIAQDHWAYVKPTRPAPPNVDDAAWSRRAIDRFVLARMQRHGLGHASTASRPTLLRRVYLDLIGLPPSLAEVNAFVADDSKDAYTSVVDRLLASPRFGEHWARHWLDLARYADSNGFQADQLRDSWAFRDWVIDAFNRDLPFDQFTVEQIAGDLLPNPTLAQRIATGFHRTVTCNVEAGVHPEANRVNQVVDRVNTTATVWLGSTIACAQCHDHKYDPFSQQEYYELFAFFNNTPIEVKNPLGNKGVRFDFYGPKMDLPLNRKQLALQVKLRREVDAIEARHRGALADAVAHQTQWERRVTAALDSNSVWQTLDAASFESTGDEDFEILADKSVLIGGRVPGTATYTVKVRTKLQGITAFKLETLTHPSLPGTGPGRGDVLRPNFILSEFSVRVDGPEKDQTRPIKLHGARADFSQKNWPVAAAIDGNPRKGWAIGGGGFFSDHHATFQTRTPVDAGADRTLTFTLDQKYGRGRTIGRFRLAAFTGDPITLDLPPAIVTILRKDARTRKETTRLRNYYRKHHADSARLVAELEIARKKLAAVRPDTTLVMVEEAKQRPTHLMKRGNYLDPGAEVGRRTPRVLHPFKASWPENRLGLARWLVDRDNPLVARVTVNRWWSQLFGRGIVSTEEDFGTRAAQPTHRQLLDWLAVEFMESGWSMKHVLRLMVTSRTYRQSSRRTDDRDPKNRFLARGPRFRMSAEMIRDNALAVSGLLSTKLGGPPVYPPQPAGLWRQTGRNEPKYVVATNEDRFRRGIYVVWRRAAPYPSFVLFDGPDRAACHPTRSRTNTPMQALALMNDEAWVEMAMALALRILTEGGDSIRDSVEHGFRRVLARHPTAREAGHLEAVFRRELQRFHADPTGAKTLVGGVRGFPIPTDADRVQLASWFYVATILLNLDETITKG